MPAEPHFGRFQKGDLAILKVGRQFEGMNDIVGVPAGTVCHIIQEQLTLQIRRLKIEYDLECSYQGWWVCGTVAERDLLPALPGSKLRDFSGSYNICRAVYASNRHYPNDLVEELYRCEEPERGPRKLVETVSGRKVWL